MDWQPIETAPKDGTPVDLWIVGADDTVGFYSLTAKKVRGKPQRAGRAPDWQWLEKPPNRANWYNLGGLAMMPLSPDVTPTHWRPIPEAPRV